MMTRKNWITMCALMMGLSLWSCQKSNAPLGPPEIDYESIAHIQYSAHVQSLFNRHCVSCHGPDRAEADLRLDSWDHLIRGSRYGEVIIPFDGENSLLVELLSKLIPEPHPVEQGQPALSQEAVNFLKRWINEGAKNDREEVPFASSTHRLYVASQNAALVNVIDTEALLVIRNVDLVKLGFRTDAKPHHVAVDPDGQNWYLSLLGENRVLKFDRQYNLIAQSDTIVLPALLARHPFEARLFVSRFLDPNNPSTEIFALETAMLQPAPDTEGGRIPVLFKVPHAIASDHAGQYVYTASLSENQLIIISAQNNEVEDFVSLNPHKGPVAIAISPDDRWAYISCQLSNEVVVVDLQSRQVVTAIPTGDKPWHLAFLPDGSRVYVPNNGSNTISVIETSSNTVMATIESEGLAQPHGIAVSKDGKYVFVSSRNTTGDYQPRHNLGDNAHVGTVVVVDTEKNQVIKILEIEEFGSGMAIFEP